MEGRRRRGGNEPARDEATSLRTTRQRTREALTGEVSNRRRQMGRAEKDMSVGREAPARRGTRQRTREAPACDVSDRRRQRGRATEKVSVGKKAPVRR